jgi:hypothetical protein
MPQYTPIQQNNKKRRKTIKLKNRSKNTTTKSKKIFEFDYNMENCTGYFNEII